MKDKIDLTFGILIAHFIPGFVVLLSIILVFDGENTIKEFAAKYSTMTVFVGSILSLACGLVLDAIRYLLTILPKICRKYREWANIDVSDANEDGRKYHDWIIEHHFRFHQFYGNLALGLMFSGIILQIRRVQLGDIWFLYCLSIVCALSAVFTYRKTLQSLRQKFSKK